MQAWVGAVLLADAFSLTVWGGPQLAFGNRGGDLCAIWSKEARGYVAIQGLEYSDG